MKKANMQMPQRPAGRLPRKFLLAAAGLALGGCAFNPFLQEPEPAEPPRAAQYQNDSLSLARQAYARGNYGVAIGHLERLLDRQPHSVAALNGLGASYDRLGRYQAARHYYFRALDLAPESAVTLSNIGYSYLLEGRAGEARRVLELALHYEPDYQNAQSKLAMVDNLAAESAAESTSAQSSPGTPQAPSPSTSSVASQPAAAAQEPRAAAKPKVVSVAQARPRVTPAALAETQQPRDDEPRGWEALPGDLRVEISNGNGVNGMAARTGDFLRQFGGRVTRLTNADNFAYPESVLYYLPGRREEAEALAALLPLDDLRLEASESLAARSVEARLRIGHDLIAYNNLINSGGQVAILD